MDDHDEDFRPLHEVAKIVGVCENTLSRWIDAGRLPTRHGATVRRRTLVSLGAAASFARQYSGSSTAIEAGPRVRFIPTVAFVGD